MTLAETTLATLVLLATPGPTNTLLFLSGATAGPRGATARLTVVLLAYLATVAPLLLAGQELLERWPLLRPLVALAAGLWVARLALRLWQPDGSGATGGIRLRDLATTTLMNPKTLVFGLVLLPSPDRPFTHLAIFAVGVLAVSTLWLGAGALVNGRGGGGGDRLVRRAAAVWLGVLSIALVWRGLGA